MINSFLRGIILFIFLSFSFSNIQRNILSSVHYEKLYDDFYKKARTDEINLTRSRGEINEDTESKVFLLN